MVYPAPTDEELLVNDQIENDATTFANGREEMRMLLKLLVLLAQERGREGGGYDKAPTKKESHGV